MQIYGNGFIEYSRNNDSDICLAVQQISRLLRSLNVNGHFYYFPKIDSALIQFSPAHTVAF